MHSDSKAKRYPSSVYHKKCVGANHKVTNADIERFRSSEFRDTVSLKTLERDSNQNSFKTNPTFSENFNNLPPNRTFCLDKPVRNGCPDPVNTEVIPVNRETMKSNSGKKNRKHWTLRGRSEINSSVLKAALAEEGCEGAQLFVAEELIAELDDENLTDTKKLEKSNQVVYWLIKASGQGNEKATELLMKMKSNWSGITAQNVQDVKWCLETPVPEKLTLKAANMIFTRFHNGEDFVSTNQLLLSVRQSLSRFPNKNKTSHRNDFGEKVSDTEGDDGHKLESEGGEGSLDNFPKEDLQKMYFQESHKLTLPNLLEVATNFNKGNLTIPLDCCDKLLPRHNLISSFYPHILLIFLIAKDFIPKTFSITSIIPLLVTWWSCHFLFLWRKKKRSFEQWGSLFYETLSSTKETKRWCIDNFRKNFILKHLVPFILINFGCVSFVLFAGYSSLQVATATIILLSTYVANIKSWFHQISLISFICLCLCPNTYFNEFEAVWINFPSASGISAGLALFLISTLTILVLIITPARVQEEAILSIMGVTAAFCLTKMINSEVIAPCEARLGLIIGVVSVVFLLLLSSDISEEILVMLILAILAAPIVLVFGNYRFSLPEHLGTFEQMVRKISCQTSEIQLSKTNFPVLSWEKYARDCHERAWEQQGVATTQWKCSKYANHLVKFTGEIDECWIEKHYMENDGEFVRLKIRLPIKNHSGDPHWRIFALTDKEQPRFLHVQADVQKSSESYLELLRLKNGVKINVLGLLEKESLGGMTPTIVNPANITCPSGQCTQITLKD